MCHECLLPTWIKSCGTFLRLAVVRLELNNMCRHEAFYELELVKWVHNYELKLKRWPQDSVTKKVQLSRYLETGTW